MGRAMIMLWIVGLLLGAVSAGVVTEKNVGFSQRNRLSGGWDLGVIYRKYLSAAVEQYREISWVDKGDVCDVLSGFGAEDVLQGLRRLHQGVDLGKVLLETVYSGNVYGVQRLLEAGADPNYLTSDGRFTPLIVASASNHVDVIRVLLSAGAKVGLRNGKKILALEYAIVFGGAGAVKVLLAAGADPNELDAEGLYPVHRACVEGYTDIVQELINGGGDITLRTSGTTSGDTPLHIAAHNGHLGLVKLLLKLGAEVDSENTKYRQTPMHRAATKNAGTVLLALIRAGGDVNHVDVDGDSPLFTASYHGSMIAIKLLLKNGADSSLANNEGTTSSKILCRCIFAATVSKFCQVENCRASSLKMISLLNP